MRVDGGREEEEGRIKEEREQRERGVRREGRSEVKRGFDVNPVMLKVGSWGFVYLEGISQLKHSSWLHVAGYNYRCIWGCHHRVL